MGVLLPLPERQPPHWQAANDRSPTHCATDMAPEVPVVLVLNGESHAVMMASPFDMEDFATGFLLSEGIVASPDRIRAIDSRDLEEGIHVNVTLDEEDFLAAMDRRRSMAGPVGCGICGVDSLKETMRALPTHPGAAAPGDRDIRAILDRLPGWQRLNNRFRGGLHAAVAVGPDGAVLAVREDVGRHNAMDKVLGAVARAGTPLGWLLTTSRCSADLVQKAATVGAGTLVVMATPTDLAVRLAQTANINLISSYRGARIVQYSAAEEKTKDKEQPHGQSEIPH